MNVRKKTLMNACLAACMFVSLLSCDVAVPFEQNADGARDFVIPQGEHYATPRVYETFDGDRLAFRATFDQSAKYDLGDASLQSNINKLMGFSDCGTQHHANSARFGWLWNNGQIDIYAYCYVDSVRMHEKIGSVSVDEENLYEIAMTAREYIFLLNGEKKLAVEKGDVCEDGLGYILYPYFGGAIPAPHPVRVSIEMVR